MAPHQERLSDERSKFDDAVDWDPDKKGGIDFRVAWMGRISLLSTV